MSPTEIVPVFGLLCAAATLLVATLRTTPLRVSWRLPAALSFAFGAFTAYTIAMEGVVTVWDLLALSYWGNQVWLDLLIAISIGWLLLLPQMRELGIRPLPWLLLVFATGCVGLLAAVARTQYVRENALTSVSMRNNAAA